MKTFVEVWMLSRENELDSAEHALTQHPQLSELFPIV